MALKSKPWWIGNVWSSAATRAIGRFGEILVLFRHDSEPEIAIACQQADLASDHERGGDRRDPAQQQDLVNRTGGSRKSSGSCRNHAARHAFRPASIRLFRRRARPGRPPAANSGQAPAAGRRQIRSQLGPSAPHPKWPPGRRHRRSLAGFHARGGRRQRLAIGAPGGMPSRRRRKSSDTIRGSAGRRGSGRRCAVPAVLRARSGRDPSPSTPPHGLFRGKAWPGR